MAAPGATPGAHAILDAPSIAPGDLSLIPDFVDAAEAAALLEAVLGRQARGGDPAHQPAQPAPPPAPAGPGWKLAAGRHVKSVGGTVLGSVLLPAPLPAWASGLIRRLGEVAAVSFGEDDGQTRHANHVLANAYPAGTGILPHTDGPAYAPCAAILSLGDGSPAVMRFFAAAETSTPTFSVFLPPRSLLVFRGGAYSGHRHGIEDADGDAVDGTVLNAEAAAAWAAAHQAVGAEASGPLFMRRGPLRVSLTVRRVLKVKCGLLRLLG